MTDEQKMRISVAHTNPSDEIRMNYSTGHIGLKASLKTKEKMSASRMGKTTWNKGILMTDEQKHPCLEETKAKLSMINTGKTLSLETRTKIGAKNRGRVQSLEQRANSSAAAIKRCTPEWRAAVSKRNWRGGKKVVRARRRLLGFIPLNEPSVGCEGHHVNNELVIYMPHKLHRSVFHRQSDGRGMVEINTLAVQWWMTQVMRTGHTLPVGGLR